MQVHLVKVSTGSPRCLAGCGNATAQSGHLNRCRSWDHSHTPGCFAGTSHDQYALPDLEFVPDNEAAVFELCTLPVTRTNDITPGSTIAMFGPGPLAVYHAGMFHVISACPGGPQLR